jgi:hypothetical protein
MDETTGGGGEAIEEEVRCSFDVIMTNSWRYSLCGSCFLPSAFNSYSLGKWLVVSFFALMQRK